MVNDSAITFHSPSDVAMRRAALIQFIWGAAGFPTHRLPSAVTRDIPTPVADLRNLVRVDELRIAMDAGQESLAHHFLAAEPNGRVVILHQGHACTFDDRSTRPEGAYGLYGALDTLLSEGFSVLAMYMPHYRPDDCTDGHAAMFEIQTEGSPLKFFLEPVAACVNYLGSQANGRQSLHDGIDMLGFSGGGWTTTVYAALDPTIRLSFPIAGSLPLYLGSGSSRDLEQTLAPFYLLAGYPELYVMGAHGPNRRQVQILNRRDTCCFGEAHIDTSLGLSFDDAVRGYEGRVEQTLAALGSGEFRVEVDDVSPGHTISSHAVEKIILPTLRATF
ncbi:MAG: hypothetical protein U0822_02980 [Anaerolineae bacterium]